MTDTVAGLTSSAVTADTLDRGRSSKPGNELNWETLGVRQAQLRRHESRTDAHDPVVIPDRGRRVRPGRPEKLTSHLRGFLGSIDA